MSDDRPKGPQKDTEALVQKYGRRGGTARKEGADDEGGLFGRFRATGVADSHSPDRPQRRGREPSLIPTADLPITTTKAPDGSAATPETRRPSSPAVASARPLALELRLPDGKQVVLIGEALAAPHDGVLSLVLEPAPINPPTLLAALSDLGTPSERSDGRRGLAVPPNGSLESNQARQGRMSTGPIARSNGSSSSNTEEREPVDPAASRFRHKSNVRRGGAAATQLLDDPPTPPPARRRSISARPTAPLSPTGEGEDEPIPVGQSTPTQEAVRSKRPTGTLDSSAVPSRPLPQMPLPTGKRSENHPLPSQERATAGSADIPSPRARRLAAPTQEVDEPLLMASARPLQVNERPRVARSRARTVEVNKHQQAEDWPSDSTTDADTTSSHPIGIDFGSCYCRMGVFRAGLELIADANQRLQVPALVPLGSKAHSARQLQETQPGCPIPFESLRLILSLGPDAPAALAARGRPTLSIDKNGWAQVEIGNRTASVRELCCALLKSLCTQAGQHLNGKVLRAVVTMPATWGQAQRDVLLEAAHEAGLEHVSFLADPVAALIAHGFRGRRGLVAVYNLGGSFEFSLLEVRGTEVRLRCAGNDPWIGGREIDENIALALADQFGTGQPRRSPGESDSWAALLRAAEHAKRALSGAETVDVRLPATDTNQPEELRATITRQQIERATRPLVRRSLSLAEQVLEHAGVSKQDISDVVLTGGCALMPIVRSIVAEFFDREPYMGDADLAVVRGAAVHAAEIGLKPDSAAQPITATARRLSVTFAKQPPLVISDVGMPLPVSVQHVHHTTSDGQTSVSLSVHDESGSPGSTPQTLVTLRYAGLPAAPAGGLKLSTTFTLTTRGELDINTTVGSRLFRRSILLGA